MKISKIIFIATIIVASLGLGFIIGLAGIMCKKAIDGMRSGSYEGTYDESNNDPRTRFQRLFDRTRHGNSMERSQDMYMGAGDRSAVSPPPYDGVQHVRLPTYEEAQARPPGYEEVNDAVLGPAPGSRYDSQYIPFIDLSDTEYRDSFYDETPL